MYIIILLLFFCANWLHTNATIQCCAGENMIVNRTCSDYSNITLNCEIRVLMGPTLDPPVTLEVTTDDDLIITNEDDAGYLIVHPDEYCITKISEKGTDLALVCVSEKVPSAATRVLFYLKSACAALTVLLLFVILVIYIFVPGLQDIEGKCILNMIASLCMAYPIIVFLPLFDLIEPFPCDTTAFIYYTGILCCMNWLSVLSFHIWRITMQPIFETQIRWCLVYFCYGYGLPLIILITALVMHHSQDRELKVGENQCLFAGNAVVWTYSNGPVIVMILISTVLQLWVAKKVWLDIDRSDQSQSVVRLRKKSLMYMHLLLVLGLMEILDIISFIFMQKNEYLDYIWDVSDCRNLLVGGIIFFILVVLRNKVLKALAKEGLFCIHFPKHWEKLIDEESEEVECEAAALTRDTTGL